MKVQTIRGPRNQTPRDNTASRLKDGDPKAVSTSVTEDSPHKRAKAK